METYKKIASLLLVLLGWGGLIMSGALACDPIEGEAVSYCEDNPLASVAGQWELMGSGSRSGCSEERFNTKKFTLTSLPFDVAQVSTGTGLDSLELASDVGDNFDLKDTLVEGTCVSFTTVENSPQGTLQYRWTGTVQYGGDVRGTFSGSGPSGCTSSGDFTLVIKNQ
jgi:hypothetical protein